MKAKSTIFLISLLIVFIFQFTTSCNRNNKKEIIEITGVWVGGADAIEIKKDTMTLYPFEKKYLIDFFYGNIILLKRIDTLNLDITDTTKIPGFFGKVFIEDETPVIYSSVDDFIIPDYKKLSKNNKISKLTKIQFSSGFWSSGYNFEIDTIGNFVIAEEGFCENHQTYSFQLQKNEYYSIFLLASYVQYDRLKSSYVCEGCSDFPRYTISFLFENDTINCFINGAPGHYSLMPLIRLLNYKSISLIKDSLNYKKENIRFFFSRLAECQNDTSSMITYYRNFDTLNFKEPEYDFKKLKQTFDKYYDFYDNNICFYIKANRSGQIIDFQFSNQEININKEFLKEVLENTPVKPAVFKGKKIDLKTHECINYIEIHN